MRVIIEIIIYLVAVLGAYILGFHKGATEMIDACDKALKAFQDDLHKKLENIDNVGDK